jgi:hypothetical protein
MRRARQNALANVCALFASGQVERKDIIIINQGKKQQHTTQQTNGNNQLPAARKDVSMNRDATFF